MGQQHSVDNTLEVETKEYDWPSYSEIDKYEWPEYSSIRGSVRLFTKRVVGGDQIEKEWRERVTKLRRNLNI